MHSIHGLFRKGRLEQLCSGCDVARAEKSWIKTDTGYGNVQWTHAFFQDVAFSPHRHDTYTIGCTEIGVQSFEYRRETWHAMPGDIFVIHPDELHDGRSGDNTAFGYRSFVVSPQDVAAAHGVDWLPFNKQAVTQDPALRVAVLEMLALADTPDRAEKDFAAVDAMEALAGALFQNSDNMRRFRASKSSQIEAAIVQRLHDRLSDAPTQSHRIAQVERDCGLDRFTLARMFKRRYGTSPYRFLIQRRLEVAKDLMWDAIPLAQVAAAAGFADQSHFTRQFRATNGLSPGQWRDLYCSDAMAAIGSG